MIEEDGTHSVRDTLKNLKPEDVRRLEVLSKIGKRINTPERFSEALEAVLEAVVESMEADRGALFLTDDGAGAPRLALFKDTTGEGDESGFRYSSTVVNKVWTELEPLAEVDAQGNVDLASRTSIQSEGIRSVICVPLIGRQSKLGVLYLDNRLSNAFTRADLQMLDVIADLASTALERARFFDALQELNQDLEERVIQRTAEAEAARVEAERATKAKSLFLAKMSHELRTPLNGVLGLTEDLARRERNPALRLQLRQVIESARSLSTLINGVLDYSKLESERVVLDRHPFSPEEAVVAAIANVNYEANQKGLEVQVWVDKTVPSEVEGDSIRIKQILINLLSNAVKFTSRGYVRLIVSAPQRDRLRFSVADSGVGIPEHKQSEIFKPFSQADASTTREYGGTGLGLSISQSLCTLLGSRLELESKVGEGSRFTFEVGLRCLTQFVPPDFSGLKVLISVPSQPQRQALERALTEWGCEIVKVVDQAELAISKLSYGEYPLPSIVLMDPGEMTEETGSLKKDRRHLMTPVTRSILARALEEILNPGSGGDELLEEVATVPEPPRGAVALIVEDHEINRLVIKKMLEGWGYECRLADCGEEALPLSRECSPRLVLMDIEMPGQDGYATAREMRVHLPHTPILAVTAHLASDLRECCLASGMDDLVSKPISRQVVAGRLLRWEQCLEGEASRSEVRHADFPELGNWPGRFLGPIHSTLSTLAALVERGNETQFEEALAGLEKLAFSAGLMEWGARCVALPRPLRSSVLKKLIDEFQQEWKALAPRLLGAPSN